MKKQLQFIIAALFLTSLTTYSQDFFPKTIDSVQYNYRDPGERDFAVVVSGYFGVGGHVNILRSVAEPDLFGNDGDYWGTNRVRGINDAVFQNKGLTGVTIPSTVHSIGNYAFDNNNLTEVTLPGTWVIGNYAFNHNNLTEVTMSDLVMFIGDGAFQSNFLTSVTLPHNLIHIGDFAFRSNNLTSVTIPANVGVDVGLGSGIGSYAFANNKLTEVTIPNRVTRIEKGTFEGNQLADVVIPGSVRRIGDFAFRFNQLSSVTLPRNLRHIGNSAFSYNNLTEVTIPNNVARIGNWAFANNPNLAVVRSRSTDPPTIEENTFTNRSNIVVVVPKGKRREYLDNGWTGFKAITEWDVGDKFTAFTGGGTSDTLAEFEITSLNPGTVTLVEYVGYKGNLRTDAIIPSSAIDFSITRIGDNAFKDKGLTSVVLPNSVTHIGNEAFRNNNLASVDIPNSVIRIGIGAFDDNNLASVTLPNSVTYIGPQAFGGNQLTEVALPNSVSLIGNWVFLDNPNLARVVSGAVVPPTIGGRTFENADRNQIDLLVPKGKKQNYESAGWTGFRSITEVDIGFTFVREGITYEITALGSTNSVMTVNYTGSANSVTIPGTVTYQGTGFEVTSIEVMAFRDNNLTSVDIPNSITWIGIGAFLNNELTSVALPESVTYIGGHAFDGNQLTEVTLPNSVTSIGFWAFSNNPNLATVVSGPAVPPTIGENSFANANRDQIDLVVPLGKRQEYLDNGWTGFKSITEEVAIGDNFTVDGIEYQVTALGSTNSVMTVNYTGSATIVTIPGTITYKEIGFEVTGIGDEAFMLKELTSVEIPQGVTFIGNSAFWNNDLTAVTIPGSITSIGAAAFAYNPNLATVVSKQIDPPIIEIDPFTNANRGQIDLVIPSGTRQEYLDNGWTRFKSITEELGEGDSFTVGGITYQVTALGIPGTVIIIGNTNTGDLTIPGTVSHEFSDFEVTGIGASAFDNNQLTSVTIGEKVTNIGERAFSINQLTSVTLPNNVTSIGSSAFAGNNLTSVEIPNNVTSIGGNAFAHNQLASVTIPESVTSIGVTAFFNNQLTSVTLPNNLTHIGSSAFQNNQLTSVIIPNSVTGIGDNAFAHNQLTSVTIGEKVTNIGQRAFRDNQLTSVTLPNNVTNIGDHAFRDNALSSVTIGENVASIRSSAFQNNQLNTVILPNSVTSIGSRAFQDNPNLATVVSKGANPPSIQANTFTNADRDQIDLFIPRGTPAGSTKAAYETTWGTGFNSITEEAAINDRFTVDGLGYQIRSLNPATVVVTGRADNSTDTDITIPGTVTHQNIDYTVTSIWSAAFFRDQLTSVTLPNSLISIGSGAFRSNNLTSIEIPNSLSRIGASVFVNNQLTSVTIGEDVTSIWAGAFRNNPLVLVMVKATNPPGIEVNTFSNRNQIDVVVPPGTRQEYLDNGWTGFKSITEEEFTVDGITYQASSTNTLTIVEYTGSATSVTIPGTITYKEIGFEVTGIGDEAFMLKELTSVELPQGVTFIGNSAFLGNDLTGVIIPNSVTGIGENAFAGNPIGSVTVEANEPPSIAENTFTDRPEIDLVVPPGKVQDYKSAGWTGFKSIAEGIQVSIDAPVQVDNLASFLVTITFNENVTGFIQEDINTFNATLVDGSFSQVNGSTYTVGITPEPGFCEGTITINVSENVAEYAPNFPNLAASATVTVNAIPSAPSVNITSVEYCVGEPADALTATGTNLLWYTAPTGGSGDANPPTPSTTTAGTTSYYVSQTIEGCESEPTQIEVTVNANPSAPSVSSSPVEYCVGEMADALTAIGDNLLWYTAPTGGSGDANAPTPTTTIAGGTSYYVSQTNTNGCESEREEIVVTVNALPVSPAINSGGSICAGEDAIFTIEGTEGDVVTYSGALNGTVTIPAGGTVEVTVSEVNSDATLDLTEVTNGGCSVPLTETATVTVNAIPSAPTVSSPVEYCVGEPADALTATGTNLLWYTAPTGGSGDANPPTPSTTTAGTTSYYVSQTTEGCESERTQIEVTVNALPSAPSVSSSPVEYCVGETADALTAIGDNLLWYTAPTGGSGDANAPTPTTTIAGSTSYYVSQTNTNGCESEREEIVVTVNALPVSPAISSGGFICAGEDAIFTIEGTEGDVVTYSGALNGTVTIPAGGTVEVTVSEVNSDATLNLTEVTNGGCSVPLTETATVTVNAIPSRPTASSPVEYCVGEPADALTATEDNLLWYTTATGGSGETTAPTPSTTTAGETSYYVSQINSNGCESERAEIVVTVEACSAQISDVFTVSNMNYEITAINPNEVKVIGYIGSATEVEIPETVDDNGETYTVTAIGANAFSDNPDLVTVKIEATRPLSIHEDAFADRSQIDLLVPAGTRDDYLNAGWTGFKSISEGTIVSIDEPAKDNLILYPNPARDKVYIDLGPGQALKQVNTYTMTGAYLYSENEREIDTSRLSEGMYLFEIVTQTGDRSMRKVIIQ